MAKRKRKASASTQFTNRVVRISVVAAVVVLCLFISLNSIIELPYFPTWNSLFGDLGLSPAPLPDDQLRVTVLDVGNADCILLQCGGQAALIDAGESNDEEAIVSTLKAAGVEKLDLVIATHADADHIGGMSTVVNNFSIGTFWMSFMPEGHEPTTKTYEYLLLALIENKVEISEAEHGATYTLGDATVTVLSGLSDYEDTNDQSVVCLVSHGEMDFVFTGDAGKEVEREILEAVPDLKAEVLKVGHHGSSTSSDGNFVRALAPEIAIITCGYGNSYGHPHTETLQTLQRNDVTVYRTDLHGQLVLTSDGKTVGVQSERGGEA